MEKVVKKVRFKGLKRKRDEKNRSKVFSGKRRKKEKTPLHHLKDLLRRSNFYANSLLSVINEQQKKHKRKVEKKLNKRKKKLKKIERKISKNYGTEDDTIPNVYKTWLESEDDQVSFGQSICFRVAAVVSSLVKNVSNAVENAEASCALSTIPILNEMGEKNETMSINSSQIEETSFECVKTEYGSVSSSIESPIGSSIAMGTESQSKEDEPVAESFYINDLIVDANADTVDQSGYKDFDSDDSVCSEGNSDDESPNTSANSKKSNCVSQENENTSNTSAESENDGTVVKSNLRIETDNNCKVTSPDSLSLTRQTNIPNTVVSCEISKPRLFEEENEEDKDEAMPLQLEVGQGVTKMDVAESNLDDEEQSLTETPNIKQKNYANEENSLKCRRQIVMDEMPEKGVNIPAATFDPCFHSEQTIITSKASHIAEEKNDSPCSELKPDIAIFCHDFLDDIISRIDKFKTSSISFMNVGVKQNPVIAQPDENEPILTSCNDSMEFKNVSRKTVLCESISKSQSNETMEKTSTEILSYSKAKVPCPVCCKVVSENKMNEHLDFCLNADPRRESLRTGSDKQKPTKPKTGKKKKGRSKLATKHQKTDKENLIEIVDKENPLDQQHEFKNIMNDEKIISLEEESLSDSLLNQKTGPVTKRRKCVTQMTFDRRESRMRTCLKPTTIYTTSCPEVIAENETESQNSTENLLEPSSIESNIVGTESRKVSCKGMNGEENQNGLGKEEERIPDLEDVVGCGEERITDLEDIVGCGEERIRDLEDIVGCGEERIPDLEDIVGCGEEEVEDMSSESESDEEVVVEIPSQLRRSSRVTRCRESYIENSDSDESEEAEEEDNGKEETTKEGDSKEDDSKSKESEEKEIDCTKNEVKKSLYDIGDVVEVPWGVSLKRYRAKILNRRKTSDREWTYLIHYIGWSEHFDDWIFTDDISQVLGYQPGELLTINNIHQQGDGLGEKFYMPLTGKKSAPVSLLRENKGLRYFKDIEVSPMQPKLLTGGALRDYQVTGYEWLKTLVENSENGILADEMGLGKTVQCVAMICRMVEMGMVGPFLVCAPMSTIQNWFSEFQRFAPKIPLVLYHGNSEDRSTLRLCILQQHKKLKTRPVVITTYDMIMRDRPTFQSHKWCYLILDEGHRIKNHKCKLLRELRYIQSRSKLLLTGTPLQNNLSELWSLLNFLLPEVFDDLKTFETWFDLNRLKKDENLLSMIHQILTPFLLRRMKCDVSLKIPPKKEVIVYAHLAPKQDRFYRALVNRSITELLQEKNRPDTEVIIDDKQSILNTEQKEKKIETTPDDTEEDTRRITRSKTGPTDEVLGKSKHTVINMSMSNIIMQLRKCCNHPYLIEYPMDCGTEIFRTDERLIRSSGKLLLLDRLLPALKKRGHKVLLFSQMTRLLDILEDYCNMRGFSQVRLDGQTSRDKRVENINKFNKNKDVFMFLLSTRAGGLGINLTAADTVIIYDSDWNPQNDAQAQDRCHRIGQERPVVVYRLVTANTVDQQIVERAAQKTALEKIIMHKSKFKGNLEQELTGNSKISPEELLQLLKASDIKCDAADKGSSVLSDEELEKLLDRSDMIPQKPSS